ncbi:MAG TPA: hypothetical protein PK253_02520 [Spirochaetota bacterium]|nr:hypothetical protein [Spirochaetota bacterium]
MGEMKPGTTVHIAIALITIFIPLSSSAEDYQYQYFHKKKRYTPFSDYIPKSRLHYQTVPHHLEDFYQLYRMKQYYNENDLRKNIERLQTALQCRFRHPSQALTKIESEREYVKYRNLMFMHINMLIMRNYLKIAHRYDKRNLYFYSVDFAEDIRNSLDVADTYYIEAIPYWEKAKHYALKASEIRITTDLGTIESERYAIITGETDFDRIIKTYRSRLQKKKNILNQAINNSGNKSQ